MQKKGALHVDMVNILWIKRKKPSTFCNADGKKCRSGGIRTRGLLVPKSLKIQASSIPTKKQNQQTFFSFEGDCIQPLAGFCNSFSPKRKGILPELLHCVNTFSVIPVICEMWFVSSYLAPCVDALRKNSLPVRNSSSVMSHNPTPYCLNHPRWKGLNPRRCPVPFQKLFHIGGGWSKTRTISAKVSAILEQNAAKKTLSHFPCCPRPVLLAFFQLRWHEKKRQRRQMRWCCRPH